MSVYWVEKKASRIKGKDNKSLEKSSEITSK